MKYPHGKSMPDNVWRALTVAGKIGFLSRGLWNKCFASGKSRWNRRQIRLLSERGLLELHSNPASHNNWVLTPLARRFLENMNQVSVGPPPVAQIHHDECIASWLLNLERQGIVTNWRMESELKQERVKDFQLSRDVRNQKYPDAVFKFQALGRERIFALEYERTRKSPIRYKDILWLYGRAADSMSAVIFVCKNLTIENTILGRMKYLKLPELWDRVALTQADQWHKDPAGAAIRLNGRVFTLRQIVSGS